MNCMDCKNYQRCTVVHGFEFNKYKYLIDHELEQNWFNNPEDITVNTYPVIEVKMVKCHSFIPVSLFNRENRLTA